MAKTPIEDLDFSGFERRYTDLRQQRDLLETQVHDLEKALTVAESKVGHLETELERSKGQLASALHNAADKETLIQSIGAQIIAHVGPAKDKALLGSPTRTNGDTNRLEAGGDVIKKVSQTLSMPSKVPRWPAEDEGTRYRVMMHAVRLAVVTLEDNSLETPKRIELARNFLTMPVEPDPTGHT